MKKLISIGASLMIAVAVFAAGSIGVNPPQKGVLYPANGTYSITNTFAYPFQTTPLLVVSAGATNSTPITNSVLTKTNFVISWPVNGSTNASFSWSAFVGGTRMQSGTFVAGSGGASTLTNTFTYPYAIAPSVVVSGSLLPTATNNGVVVSTVTTTGFIVSTGNTNQTIYWQAIGTVANPQTEYQGQYPRSNPVIY